MYFWNHVNEEGPEEDAATEAHQETENGDAPFTLPLAVIRQLDLIGRAAEKNTRPNTTNRLTILWCKRFMMDVMFFLISAASVSLQPCSRMWDTRKC